MNFVRISFIIILCLNIFSLSLHHELVNTSINNSQNVIYAVALTTIPPRFSFIDKVLLSWIKQFIRPIHIYIFVPKRYKRFKMKKDKLSIDKQNSYNHKTLKTQLYDLLVGHEILKSFMLNKTINIIELDYDWGPATKFIGIITLLHDYLQKCEYNNDTNMIATLNQLPTFWLLCDDDVTYDKYISHLYTNTFINTSMYNTYYDSTQLLIDTAATTSAAYEIFPELQYNNNFIGYTLFTDESRVIYQLSHNPTITYNIPHIQGVDTYVISTISLIYQYKYKLLLYLPNLTQIMLQFHQKLCIESFYQDDYIISFLLHVSGIKMKSLRNSNTSLMVHSIDGLSKAYFQMHMDEEVFIREYITQQCIMIHANDIYRMVYNKELLI